MCGSCKGFLIIFCELKIEYDDDWGSLVVKVKQFS